MIESTIERWHAVIRGEADLDGLLHEDCVFWSPVLFRPQEGRNLTKLYLMAAAQVFPGDGPTIGGSDSAISTTKKPGFRYTRQILEGHHAALEFETTMGEISVNGVDLITCDDSGQIVEFKVMLRPLKAVEVVRDRMAAIIAKPGND